MNGSDGDPGIQPVSTPDASFKGRAAAPLLQIMWFAWGLVLCWAGTEFFLSSCTGHQISRFMLSIPQWDKVCHIVAFAAGGGAMAWAIGVTWRPPVLWTFLISVFLVSFFGATDEWHQLYTPGRSGADFFDWLADTVGAIVGASAFLISIYARDFATRSRDAHLGIAPGN